LACAQEARDLAGDDIPEVRFAGGLISWFTNITLGRRAESVPYQADMEAHTRHVESNFLRGLWSTEGGLHFYWDGRFREALDHLKEWRPSMNTHISAEIAHSWVSVLSLTGLGRFQEALDLLGDSLKRSERCEEFFYRIRIINTFGWIYNELELFDWGETWSRLGVDVAVKAEKPDIEVENNARLNLADSLIGLGRLDEAEAELAKVRASLENPQPEDRMSIWTYTQHFDHSFGELKLLQGDLDEAGRSAQRCLENAESSGRGKNVSKAQRLLGQIATARKDYDAARGHLRAAIESAKRIENPTQLRKSWLALAETEDAARCPAKQQEALARTRETLQAVANALDDDLRAEFEKTAVWTETQEALAGGQPA
jgi:tetratricopeptide (TPR) repeat protein